MQPESRDVLLTIGVVFMWIGSAMVAADIGFGTWLTAGPMIVIPAVSGIGVCAASFWRRRFGYLVIGCSSFILPLIAFVLNGWIV